MKYWVYKESRILGPFDKEAVSGLPGLDSGTLVCAGDPAGNSWMPAGELTELSDNERTTLDMVEAAIRKIDNGTYGLCEATQKPITRARLEAIPYARYSIAYQNQLEQKVTEAAEPGLDFSVIGETERAGD